MGVSFFGKIEISWKGTLQQYVENNEILKVPNNRFFQDFAFDKTSKNQFFLNILLNKNNLKVIENSYFIIYYFKSGYF